MSLNFWGCSRMCGLVTSVEYVDAEIRVMEVEMLDLEWTWAPIYLSPSFISLPPPSFQDVTQVSHGVN